MRLDKLAKRLRREASANPKKAGVLALLVVVALYFWAPLIVGWCGKKGVAGQAQAVAPAAPGAATTATQPVAVAPVVAGDFVAPQGLPGGATWQQLSDAIVDDLRTKPVRPLPLARDPFMVATKPDAGKQEEKDASRIAPPPTPQALGLSLSGTVLGGGRRLARLAGKNFAEGQTIEATKDGRTWQFVLSRVEAKRVVLSRDGEDFELTLSKRGRSGLIELTRSN